MKGQIFEYLEFPNWKCLNSKLRSLTNSWLNTNARVDDNLHIYTAVTSTRIKKFWQTLMLIDGTNALIFSTCVYTCVTCNECNYIIYIYIDGNVTIAIRQCLMKIHRGNTLRKYRKFRRRKGDSDWNRYDDHFERFLEPAILLSNQDLLSINEKRKKNEYIRSITVIVEDWNKPVHMLYANLS